MSITINAPAQTQVGLYAGVPEKRTYADSVKPEKAIAATAVAGIIAGAAVDVLWLIFCANVGLYEIIPGFFAGLVVAIVASLCSAAPSEEVEELFDLAAKGDL